MQALTFKSLLERGHVPPPAAVGDANHQLDRAPYVHPRSRP